MLLDVETKAIAALNTAGVLGGNVSSRLPRDFEASLPWGTLRRAPGGRYIDTGTRTLEAARFQVNAYGVDDVLSFDAMAELLEGIAELEGTGLDSDVFVSNVDITQTAAWAPDPETGHPAYVAFVAIYARDYRHVV